MCHYIVTVIIVKLMQIHSIGRYGASHPLQETYVINTECKECFLTASCIADGIKTSIKYNLIQLMHKASVLNVSGGGALTQKMLTNEYVSI